MEMPQILDRVAKFLPTKANSASMALMSKSGRAAVKGRELSRHLIRNLRQHEDLWVHVYQRWLWDASSGLKKLMPRKFTFYFQDPRVWHSGSSKSSFSLMTDDSGRPFIFSIDMDFPWYKQESEGALQSKLTSVFDMGRKDLQDVVGALDEILAASVPGLDQFDKMRFDLNHSQTDAVQRSRLWSYAPSAHKRHTDLLASRSILHPTSVQGRQVNADIRSEAAKLGHVIAHNNQLRAKTIARATVWRTRILLLIDLLEKPVVQSARSRLKGNSAGVIYTGGRPSPNEHRK